MRQLAESRLHLDIAPMAHVDLDDEVDRLTRLGARPVDVGLRDAGRVVMADPDDNEFCVLRP